MKSWSRRNAVERRQLKAENTALRQTLQAQQEHFAGIIGRSARMKQVFNLIIQAAPSRSTILITGESGTGKELVARAIHAHFARRPCICHGELGKSAVRFARVITLRSREGRLHGAVYLKKGLCDVADRGSIFFDEIGNIPLDTQAKLLRVMQEREFMRLGGWKRSRSMRIIAATNCDLREMVGTGRFREDLYYRLHVINISLRRCENEKRTPVLCTAFSRKAAAKTTNPGSS